MDETVNALEQLANLVLAAKRRKYASVPAFAVPRTKFSDKTTNELTKAVIACLEVHNCYVTRIQSQGQYRDGRFTPGTTKRGTADIHAVYAGQHLSIEIKAGKDRMSKAQLETAEQVKQAGGIYLIVRRFQVFWEWFDQFRQGGINE